MMELKSYVLNEPTSLGVLASFFPPKTERAT